MIHIQNVSKRFADGTVALRDISLRIERGEVFGIVGASGAGKSTLLRCINALETPTSGSVVVDGLDLSSLDKAALRSLRRRIGMIFQGFHLFENKTVYENVAFPLRLIGSERGRIDSVVRGLLDRVELSDKASSYPSRLSGGQKQRAAIARAIATDPSILLCDEATSALDPKTTVQILDLLRDINQERGITIVLITHEMSVVKRIADRMAILSEGGVQRVGRTSEIFASDLETVAEDGALRIPDGAVRGRCFALRFPEKSTSTHPIITKAARTLDIDINILTASLEYIQGRLVGQLLIGIDASMPEEKVGELKKLLTQHQVEFEEVRRE